MFSEYASRFLAQSQSRIAQRPEETGRNGSDRSRRQYQGSSRFPASRSYLQRAMNNPYQPASSQVSHFPFASRMSAQPAPLFYSATDEFREEDDELEHEREIADLYALQRSRRHFGSSQLEQSSELDDDGGSSEASGENYSGHEHAFDRPGGIRSSWRAGKAASRRNVQIDLLPEEDENEPADTVSRSSGATGKGKMVDVGLEDTLRSDLQEIEPGGIPDFTEEEPPVIQQFRKQPRDLGDNFQASPSPIHENADKQTLLDHGRPSSPTASLPPSMSQPESEPPSHDAFWGHLFWLSLAGLFATAFLVYLHTSAPAGDPSRWGDTVYTAIHGSLFLLTIYTFVSIFVSLLWLALLRYYVRHLAYGMIIAVPVILFSFSLYPFVSSFKGSWHGTSVQDKVMRFGSLVPFLLASAWVYTVIKGRHATGKAINILEFACRILVANPALLALGFAVLLTVVTWTWIWTFMFTRVFLGGHFLGPKNFVIDFTTWWLAAYFIFVYLWSLGAIAGLQRSVTAATVSQWYFHRLAVPAPTSRQIVHAAFVHSATTLFGTVCLSSLLRLLVRLPLIIFPRRISSIITLVAYSIIPTPISALTNPLALTYAAIHSRPLAISAHGLSQMTFLAPATPGTTLQPRSFSRQRSDQVPLLPYRLSKLVLHATRFMMSLALGFGGWVTTARTLRIAEASGSIRGSLYAYIVGLIAGAIGWGVLGAMEGVIADIVDAAVVCWGIEVGASSREARYCREAGWLFGDDWRADTRDQAQWNRV
ncbi:conserved hypothetical protein [Paecilomyces variotii No. 5]|uniref:Protein PNS1 n=1 Tax=Byssochlamys spectabilis (strain No. 5 / NBRC 109023) TaxID=1356009 RepID=V5FZ06_BYSSN|nr:conserved hypothetical protein [Paecilomyces variotii No. 5]